MQRTAITSVAFCAAGGAIILGVAIGVLRQVHFRQLFSRLKSLLLAIPAAMESQSKADEGEVAAIVKERMQTVKLERFRWTMRFLCAFGCVTTALMISVIAVGQGRRDSVVADFVQIVVLGCVGLPTVFPHLLSWRTIDWFYCVFPISAAIIVSPWVCDIDKAIFWVLFVDLGMLFLNVVRGSAGGVLLLNVPFVLASSATMVLRREMMPVRAEFLVLTQFCFISLFPACIRALEVSMASAIRQSVEAQATKELFAAASALIRSCCDVVVEVSSDGVILSPAWDLGGFLLRGPGCNLQGFTLTDLLSSENDRRLFLRKLRAPRPSGLGVAEAVHVRMRDGNNQLLKVEILSFEFRHLDGQPRHMIGLREFSDRSAASSRRQRAEERPGDAPAESGSDVGLSSEDEEPSGLSGVSGVSSSTDPYDVSLATLIVDTTDAQMPIRGCSSGFQMHIGRLAPGTCFMDLLPEQSREDFAAWIRMAAQYGKDWPASRLILNMRQGKIRTRCSVAQDAADDEELDRERLHLLFRCNRHVRGHSDGCRGYKAPTTLLGTPVHRMAL